MNEPIDGSRATAIRVRGVKKTFGSGDSAVVALKGVDLEARCGEMLMIVGPSGCGKTTLLSVICGTMRYDAGSVEVFGSDLHTMSSGKITAFRGQNVGFIFQQFNLIKGLTALENVMLPAYPDGERFSLLRHRAMELLDRLDLSQKAASRVEWLSGGEAQRVTIARALMNDPAVVIADEPTAHLDSKLSSDFMVNMERLREGGRTIVIASHDPIVHEFPAVDRVLAMRDGRIVS